MFNYTSHLELEINGEWVRCYIDTSSYAGVLSHVVRVQSRFKWRIIKIEKNLVTPIASGDGFSKEDNMDSIKELTLRKKKKNKDVGVKIGNHKYSGSNIK